MSTSLAPAEVEVEQPDSADEREYDRPWVVIVWNDPINLMSYVTLVLQKLFGYNLARATKLMLQVHNEGKAVVSSGKGLAVELLGHRFAVAPVHCAKLEGTTARQKNPHPRGSLAHAAWVCARLGGWTGYYGKPGPVVMLHGWLELNSPAFRPLLNSSLVRPIFS